ncbi:hypothetical protein ACHAW5_005816 [Stephanodiscus triporus]|uniref:COP9 signalosome complex subunit 3 N-terminal helical repeats domain-containing protein n=1 Tax=Stephanodiscus triporus TaxID=2934178 RepID=A0ABD3PZQ6_9STRA
MAIESEEASSPPYLSSGDNDDDDEDDDEDDDVGRNDREEDEDDDSAGGMSGGPPPPADDDIVAVTAGRRGDDKDDDGDDDGGDDSIVGPHRRHDDDDDYDDGDGADDYPSALSRALTTMMGSSRHDDDVRTSTTTTTTTTTNMIDLLRAGAGTILVAGREAGARDDRVAFLPTATTATATARHPRGGESSISRRRSIVDPDGAELYLRAVAACVDALGAVVASSSSSDRCNVAMGGGGGAFYRHPANNGESDHPVWTVAAKGVVEIVAVRSFHLVRCPSSTRPLCGTPSPFSFPDMKLAFDPPSLTDIFTPSQAAGVAASFAGSRSVVARSGIVQALARLIEDAGKAGGDVARESLTPFHAEYLRACLLAGQYRRAHSFLSSRPIRHATLDSACLRLDPTSCLRAHYHAGLVHLGCEAWDDALDSFHACLVLPCSVVSSIAVAARKKGLLVRCLMLGGEELDGVIDARVDDGGGGAGGRTGPTLEDRILSLPGGASAAVAKFMSVSSNRVGRADPALGGGGGASASAPERTAGSETSEGSAGRERSSRRRTRGANPDRRAAPSLSSSTLSGGAVGVERRGPTDASSTSRENSHLGSYHDLVSAYVRGNADHYAKLLSEMTGLLRSDGNWGLAKRLEGRLRVYRTIRKVASVYSVVGVDVLEVKMQEAGASEVDRHGIEDVLMGMLRCDAGDPLLVDPFVARMDQSTGMVSFLDDVDESFDIEDEERRMEADLSARLQSCIALAERVRDLDIALTTSPKYQQYAMKEMMMKGDLTVIVATATATTNDNDNGNGNGNGNGNDGDDNKKQQQ